MNAPPSLAALQMMAKLKKSLRFFARTQLEHELKEGGTKHLEFNRAQEHIHNCLEYMLAKYGYVRAIIIKGRQQGCSTYVAARFFHKCIFNTAKSVFILSHEEKTTNALFDKVEMYYNSTAPQIKPGIKEDNAKNLVFKNLSKYGVGTAGSKSTGRGLTSQLFHGSEPAWWENVKGIKAGAMQAFARVPGNEMILETTANGQNWMYKFTMESLKDGILNLEPGATGFMVIFVPWYWQDEYRSLVPANFVRTEEEEALVEVYGLADAQLQWRRETIMFLDDEGDGEMLFKQEYPCTLQEAFQSSGDAFFNPVLVDKARNSNHVSNYGANILGVDPARGGKGGDRTVVTYRKGREIKWIRVFKEQMDNVKLANILKEMVKEYKIDKIYIDMSYGNGTYDIMRNDGYDRIIEGVYFGEAAHYKEFCLNRRAEMAFEFRDWLKGGDVALPDDQDMASDIASMPMPEPNANSKMVFKSKEKIKAEIGRSPDILDSIMLTFAGKVMDADSAPHVQQTQTSNQTSHPSLTVLSMLENSEVALCRGVVQLAQVLDLAQGIWLKRKKRKQQNRHKGYCSKTLKFSA